MQQSSLVFWLNDLLHPKRSNTAVELVSFINQLMTKEEVASKHQIISLLDFTLLDLEAKEDKLQRFARVASEQPIAAVCVYPCHLSYVSSLACKKVAVVNFPDASLSNGEVLDDIEQICSTYKLDEIDYVFPWKGYQSGAQAQALQQSLLVAKACHLHKKKVKVIVESGAFTDFAMLKGLSLQLVGQGFDFLKTSTGHYRVGASFQAANLMLQAIVESGAACGLKVSGGISKPFNAQQYIQLAKYYLGQNLSPDNFRIGASRLLDELSR